MIKSKTVDVRFIVDNQNGELIPSMFGKANIEVKKGEKLILPKQQFLKADSYYVFKPTQR